MISLSFYQLMISIHVHLVISNFLIAEKWLMQKHTDGKTESSSLSSSCMTLTTMAGKLFKSLGIFAYHQILSKTIKWVVKILNILLSWQNIEFSFFSLDKNDFECLAVRNTVIEGKGAWDEAKYKANSEIMAKLWNEIADLADFDKVRRLDNCFLMLYETSFPSKNVV